MAVETLPAGIGRGESLTTLETFAVQTWAIVRGGMQRIIAGLKLEQDAHSADHSQLTQGLLEAPVLEGILYANNNDKEPPVEKQRGISNKEAKKMNKNKTVNEAQAAGRKSSRILGKAAKTAQNIRGSQRRRE